jgi:small-conductance mechanosensitive channel
VPLVRPPAPLVDVLELHPFRADVMVRRLAAAALLASVVLVSGCGGGKSEESSASQQAAWANGLCSAVSKWKASMESVGSTVKNVDQLSKAKIEQASKDVSAANARLEDDLKALGDPPKSGSSEAKAALESLSKELQASADDIRNATKGVSTVTEAAAAVNVASGALLAMSSDISATAARLQSLDAKDTWKKAFTDSEACKSLKS